MRNTEKLGELWFKKDGMNGKDLNTIYTHL